MPTTLVIADHLLIAATRGARRRGVALGDLGAALRHEPAKRQLTIDRPAVPILPARGGLRPGVDATSIRLPPERIDEAVPVERLRRSSRAR